MLYNLCLIIHQIPSNCSLDYPHNDSSGGEWAGRKHFFPLKVETLQQTTGSLKPLVRDSMYLYWGGGD